VKIIKFTDPHRQKHFDFFNTMANPHFNISANLNINKFLKYQKETGIPFNISMVYLISKTANQIDVFKQRIRKDKIVQHEIVNPSFTVETDASDVFSFCYVDYHENAKTFLHHAKINEATMKDSPSFADEAGKDDYLFLSALPWISFTSIQHAMHQNPDSVPRISWGKYFEDRDSTKMPLSVQTHHGLVNGKQVGLFFQIMQKFLDEPEEVFNDEMLE